MEQVIISIIVELLYYCIFADIAIMLLAQYCTLECSTNRSKTDNYLSVVSYKYMA